MFKPILFNTDMVRAILEGRKTVTRRPIKPQPAGELRRMGEDSCYPGYFAAAGEDRVYRPPYMVGDVLYVRETWSTSDGSYLYRAWPGEGMEPENQDWAMREMGLKWRPSIHMPREAARIFLRVTDVRVERLQDINLDPTGPENQVIKEGLRYLCDFIAVWQNTLKRTDWPVYGWDANPWVWVIEFERITKEE